jgi:hypothetical protein
MKKFLLLSLLAGAMLFLNMTAKAQTNPFGNGQQVPLAAGDTLTNVDSVMKFISAGAGYRDIGIQVYVNKLTGTPAGKLILMSSMDGVTYLQTDSIALASPQVNSAVTPAAFLTAQLSKTGAPFTHYMVMVTNTAASTTAQVRVWYTLRREQVTQVY